MARIAVALSGGVDSAVSAYLLKEQGHEVAGFYMKNWSLEDQQSLIDCPWEQDQSDAEAVCAHLGIPFRSLNLEKEYRAAVVDTMLEAYSAGMTPNPDVLCNTAVKFGVFREAVRNLGFEDLATGHYVQLEWEGGMPVLKRGWEGKDQSYFLYQLSDEQLQGVHFPVGHLPKQEVRQIAEKAGLPVAAKKDSQGICFIGKLDLKTFLKSHAYNIDSAYEVRLLSNDGTWLERTANSKVVGRGIGKI